MSYETDVSPISDDIVHIHLRFVANAWVATLKQFWVDGG